MTPVEGLTRIRQILDRMTVGLCEDSTVEEYVEVGTVFFAVITSATGTLNEVKTVLREDALEELNRTPGQAFFNGDAEGEATVTVPNPKLKLVKDADIGALQSTLGVEFSKFFTTKITHTPCKGAGDLVAALPPGAARSLLLASLKETPETPRVSFRRPHDS